MSYIDKKNSLAERLRIRIAEFAVKNNKVAVPASIKSHVDSRTAESTPFDPTRFRIRMYFESTCPHCKQMMSTLRSLQDQGVYVEALQIDKAPVHEAQFPIATSVADPTEVKKNAIQSVPFTLIADLKAKTVLAPITGYKSIAEMKAILNAMVKQKNNGENNEAKD